MDLASKDLTKVLRKFVLWVFILGFLVLGSAMLVIAEFKISVFSIRGSSMEPTLYSGDTAIIKKGDQIEQGHLVFFTKPEPWTIYGNTGREVPLAKRVGALPGDILSYDGETFKVNGEILYSLDEDKYECTDGEIDYTHVLTNTEFFVVGDNATESLDSRSIFCKGYTQYMYISKNSILNYGKLIKVL